MSHFWYIRILDIMMICASFYAGMQAGKIWMGQ